MTTFSYFINKKLDLFKIILLLFCFSGYDLTFLNDENLLFNIFFFIIIFFFLKFKSFLARLNKVNKIILIKEYYHKFYLIKAFYLTYVNYLIYSFNIYENYYKYYNYFLNYFSALCVNFNKNIYILYIKLFFNYLNIQNNLITFNYIELKYLTLLNLYYILKISNFLKIDSLK